MSVLIAISLLLDYHFGKMPVLQALAHIDVKEQDTNFDNQLNLFS
jgi:hypothetical protein